MEHRSLPTKTCLELMLLGLLCALYGCSGGGGGGESGNGRTTETGVRILHGGIDAPTYSLRIGLGILQTAHYLQQTSYVPVGKGPAEVILELANFPGSTVFRLPVTLAEDTEYSILVLGQASQGTLNAVLIPEPVQRPDTGRANLQFVNAYSADLQVLVGTVPLALRRGLSSGFIDAPITPQTVQIFKGSTKLSEFAVSAADRGETTVLISGSEELGLIFTQVFADLD